MRRVISFFLAVLIVICLPLCAFAAGTAPVAENLELLTYKNVSVGGCMTAFDAENDVVAYEITTKPVKGSIQADSDGNFIYTPNTDKKGRDYFGYKAIDAEGNYSQEATVIIKIEKQKKPVSYADMQGSAVEYYAVALSEEGLFTGECICGQYCFYPEREVTRGEFVSLCIAASGNEIIKNVMSTGFDDDEKIPEWMKQYALASAMSGHVDEKQFFNADKAISKQEAAAQLNSVMNMNNVKYKDVDGEMKDAQACANLEAAGIVREGLIKEETLKRAEAAELIIKALQILKNR